MSDLAGLCSLIVRQNQLEGRVSGRQPCVDVLLAVILCHERLSCVLWDVHSILGLHPRSAVSTRAV